MTTPSEPTPSVRKLLDHLAEGSAPGWAVPDLAGWLAGSPRVRAFVETNRDKVRKKVRGATSADALLDVRAELLVAALLLADRRFEVAFEAYGAGRRGPDFTVTYRAGRAFNVEVTRRRSADASLGPVIGAKLRQLPPSASNVLVVVVKGDAPADPAPAIRELRTRSELEAGLLRLAAVIVVAEAADGAVRTVEWSNAGARIPLPHPTHRALLAALAPHHA